MFFYWKKYLKETLKNFVAFLLKILIIFIFVKKTSLKNICLKTFKKINKN